MFPSVDQETSSKRATDADDTIRSIVEQLPPSLVLRAKTLLSEISQTFQSQSTHAGALIHLDDGSYCPVYRDQLFIYLARPFFSDLYGERPVSKFISQHHIETLVLSLDTSITAAIEAALQRKPQTRYDPILVKMGQDEPPRIVDVRLLLERQRELLSNALSAVELQRHEAHFAATHDRLTGLPNRESTMSQLHKMSASHQSDPTHDYAVLFLDFDRFKLINDSLGHDAGDELLVQISHRLRETVARFTGEPEPSERWMTARLGGDEFLILIDRLQEVEQAQCLADAVIKAMKTPFSVRGHEVSSTPSIGIATSRSSNGKEPAALVRDADTAMYRAKAQGRARYALFDQSMLSESLERLHLEAQLRKAGELNQFIVHYQPIVDCESGEVAGFEALARWQHPDMGMVSPGKFIPIAEECGVITTIGRFMLEQAIAQLASWSRVSDKPLYMSINVSKRQLLKPGFIAHLKNTIEKFGVEPSLVNLEVTETVIIGQADTIIATLEECKQLGVKLSMDDFGTGLSSLTHLHQYPVDVLKIDQAFVKHLEEKSVYTAVVLAIVTLAKNLGMSIVVEGIERIEQLVQMQALDCEYAQGYLFSKPVPAEEAGKLIKKQTMASHRGLVA